MTKTEHPEALTHRNRKPVMIHIGREIAYHHGLCGLCDEQLRQLGERWHNGLHSQIDG